MSFYRDNRGEIGLSRLVLIKSGVCDYCEINPAQSTHLSGENGLGKTSILNALQFLVIDNWNQMSFPNSPVDTKDHYFQSEFSTIVFELLTVEGTQHLIVLRGESNASTDRYKRYAVRGSYDRNQFLDFVNEEEFECRDFSETLTLMSDEGREVTPFKGASEMREFLRSKIKWLPTKESGNVHRDFITLLKTLNTLGEVRERDLKEVLMNINEGIQRTVDFRTEYSDIWRAHLDRRRLVFEIERNSLDIDEYSTLQGNLSEACHDLDSRLDDLGPSIEHCNSNSKEHIQELESQIAQTKAKVEHARQDLNDYTENKMELKSEQRDLERRISSLEEEKSWAEEQDGRSLEKRYEELVSTHSIKNALHIKLQTLERTPSMIQKQLKVVNDRIARLERVINQAANTLMEDLGENNLLKHSSALRFLNQDLLPAIGKVSNADAAERFLSEIEQHIVGNELDYRGIMVHDLSEMGAVEFDDLDTIRDQIRLSEKERSELESQLAIIENWEASKRELVALQGEMEIAFTTLKRFQKWERSGTKEIQESRTMNQDLKERIAQLDARISQKKLEIESLSSNLQDLSTKLAEHEDKVSRINSIWSEFHHDYRENVAYSAQEIVNFEDLEVVIQGARELYKEIQKTQKKIHTVRDRLLSALKHIFSFATIEEFSQKVIDAQQKIGEQKESVETEWKNLITNMSRAAALMQDSLKKLNREVNEINRVFSNIQVSNLEEFTVEFHKKSSDLDLISQFTAFDAHTNDPNTLQAIQSLGDTFMKNKSIDLADIFYLKFRVKNKGGRVKVVEDLDTSGSTGTVVLIKAVLLMILLKRRTSWRKERTAIPFFLDEVGVFGSNNKGQIVEVAKNLDFQVFTASPDAMEEADIVYPILGGRTGDRIFVTPLYARPRPRMTLEEELG